MSSLTRIDLSVVESRIWKLRAFVRPFKLLSQFLISGLLISAITVANVVQASDFDPGAGYQGGYDPQAAFPTVFGYSGQSRFVGPNKPVKKWFVENLRTQISIQNTPVIGRDGTIYLVTPTPETAELHAINSNGTQKWIFNEDELYIYSSPTISTDGTIYVFGKQSIYAITPSGTSKWKLEIGSVEYQTQPTIGLDGTIYAITTSGLVAINPDGSKKWVLGLGTDGRFYYTPVVDKDGVIYAIKQASNGGSFVVAINQDGTKKWETESSFSNLSIHGVLALGNDGSIYAGAMNALIAFKNSTGEIKWRFDLTNPTMNDMISSPVVSKDGSIYFYGSEQKGGENFKNLYALNPNGSIKWTYQQKILATWPGGMNDSRLVIDANGVIYTGFESSDGVFAINPNGTLKWQFKDDDLQFGVSPMASIAIGSDGTLYFAAVGNKNVIYALGDNATSCLGKHATFDTATGLVTIPALDIPTLDPFTGESTGTLATFSAQLKLLKGIEDFGLVTGSFKVLQVDVKNHDSCNAEYTYADGDTARAAQCICPMLMFHR